MPPKIQVTGNAAPLFARLAKLREERDNERERHSALLQEVGKLNDTLGVIDLCMVESLVEGLRERVAALEEDNATMRVILERGRTINPFGDVNNATVRDLCAAFIAKLEG